MLVYCFWYFLDIFFLNYLISLLTFVLETKQTLESTLIQVAGFQVQDAGKFGNMFQKDFSILFSSNGYYFHYYKILLGNFQTLVLCIHSSFRLNKKKWSCLEANACNRGPTFWYCAVVNFLPCITNIRGMVKLIEHYISVDRWLIQWVSFARVMGYSKRNQTWHITEKLTCGISRTCLCLQIEAPHLGVGNLADPTFPMDDVMYPWVRLSSHKTSCSQQLFPLHADCNTSWYLCLPVEEGEGEDSTKLVRECRHTKQSLWTSLLDFQEWVSFTLFWMHDIVEVMKILLN